MMIADFTATRPSPLLLSLYRNEYFVSLNLAYDSIDHLRPVYKPEKGMII